MNFNIRLLIILLTVPAVLSGFLLLKKGAPYPVLIFTLHKLFSAGTAVLYAVILFKKLSAMGFPALNTILAVLYALSAILLIVSGALMSIKIEGILSYQIIHRILSVIIVGTGLVNYFIAVN